MAFSSISTLSPQINSNPHTFRNREFRVWRRRRLKLNPKRRLPLLRNNLLQPSSSPPPSHFEFLSLFSFDWIPTATATAAAALGFAALSHSSKTKTNDSNSSSNPNFEVGEWILFSSPTPFNRFVLLRCPSISFDGVEDLNNKLVKEEKHYVRLDSGRIELRSKSEERENGFEFEYQRECVRTEDGGVISLDWPANLDLNQEHGLDTTVLLVPGTVEGSMDESVRSFVGQCLKRGLFPVVINPRGCGGSPLTTARLFTAADSDDICSAIQFIARARPWSTLTGVGWGYGANMLTKYLAEAGEKTPFMAATCIDNPFDLDEATRTSPYNTVIDKKLTAGLIDILKSNKELFQGRRKGFDVDKALSAESVRDFEEAISMISHGFDTIEEFYAHSSTRSLVGKLKVPVLFIQNDDGTVPLFSIPRGLIAENPFTSLLLCSCLPSNVTAISWYQQVTVEWLTAVELGLLKGRHPLLQDIDVTINPSKGLALVEGRTDANGGLDTVMNLPELDSSDACVDPMKEMLQGSDVAANFDLKSNQVLQRSQDPNQTLSEINGASANASSIDADSANDSGMDMVESDTGQVLQTAQVVMNMLDVTMPGTLKEEDKRKVLEAVDRGETLIKALQDAVPEDVRGKLTTSVSEILQGKNLNFDRLLSINQIANVSSGLRSTIKEKVNKHSDVKSENDDHTSDEKVRGNDLRDGSSNNQVDMDDLSGQGTGAQPKEKSVKSSDPVESKSVNKLGDDTGSTKVSTDIQNSDDKLDSDLSSKKVGQLSELGEDGCEPTAKMSSSSQNAGSTDSGEVGILQNNRSQDDETIQLDAKESSGSTGVANHQDLSNDQNRTSSLADTTPADISEAAGSQFSEGQLSDKGNDDGKSNNEKVAQPLPVQSRASDAKSPTFSVSQAFDALTGLDDSTQVAVNSVFGVIEDMLTQLEEKRSEGNEKGDTTNGSGIEKNFITSKPQLEQTEGEDQDDASPLDIETVSRNNCESNVENNPTTTAEVEKNNHKIKMVVDGMVGELADKPAQISRLPFDMTTNPYARALYHEYLRKYIISKVRNAKPLDLDASTSLSINYIPEGHWRLLEQPGGIYDVVSYNSIDNMEHATQIRKENVADDVIEPSYVILDSERQEEPTEELREISNDNLVNHDSSLENSKYTIKTFVLDSLKVEVGRRLSAVDMKDMEDVLAADMEEVANAAYLAIQHDKELNQHIFYSGFDHDDHECSRLDGNHIVEGISLAVQNTSYLKRVLPVGVIVGSSLAALRKFFDVAAAHDTKDAGALDVDQDCTNLLEPMNQVLHEEPIQQPSDRIKHDPVPEKNSSKEGGSIASNALDKDDNVKVHPKTMNRDSVVVGAVTAALGASAFLTCQASQQDGFMGINGSETSSTSSEEKHVKHDKNQSNLITSFAEKAMSVAAPVVPTKESGGVDHERLVATLAELGQRGGLLKLVGKLALLWGGLRGAMSLTDRLISFLRIGERPLLQRVLGFFCMVLVLWSPVLVPLLPTLFHNWATHNSSRIAELPCIAGLYTAVTTLIMQWGKRVRGYEYPLKEYGLDFMSARKVQDFLIGLVGGVTLVLCIQSVNALLGFVDFSWPSNLSSSLDLATKIKAYGKLFLLAAQGIVTAAGIAFVEELLFRSWLLEEIAADLGYHPAIILSGLAFSLSQRSLLAIPGLWLLSICLAGSRLRKQGSLFIPIGLRTGIIASCFILQMGGFLIFQPNFHQWVTGTHPFQPLSGVVGLAFALALALVLYPRQPFPSPKFARKIRA